MSDHKLTILITAQVTPELVAEIKGVSPRIEVIGAEDIERDPSLLARVEIAYGRIKPQHWAQAPNLRWVQATSAGVEHVLTPEAIRHPVTVTNVHIYAVPMAEHLFGMLLTLTRRLHIAYRQQLDRKWDSAPFLATVETLPGKTLGLVGLGAIGSRAAEIGHSFGLRILGMRRRAREVSHVEKVYTPADKHEMLAQCDYIMVTLPLTAETRHFFDDAAFEATKRGALLFNVGRGGTVDTEALVCALQDGRLGGAGLDVAEPEPLPSDHPLWEMPNVIITPHFSGIHLDYQRKAGDAFVGNLRRYLAGEELLNIVDKAAGY